MTNRLSPSALPPVSLGRSAVAVNGGDSTSCALLDNGTVSCWGYNGLGGLGVGDYANRQAPAAAISTTTMGNTALDVQGGAGHTCALLSDKTVKCWGENTVGALGYGDKPDRNAPPASAVSLW